MQFSFLGFEVFNGDVPGLGALGWGNTLGFVIKQFTIGNPLIFWEKVQEKRLLKFSWCSSVIPEGMLMSVCEGGKNTLNLARILLENVIYNYILQLESLGPGEHLGLENR